jgi:hypothetical protein
MSEGGSPRESAAERATSHPEVEAMRDACAQTRGKYSSSINGIKKWINETLSKTDKNTSRFFNENGSINLAEFTPSFFESFLVYKSDCEDGDAEWISQCYQGSVSDEFINLASRLAVA